MRRAFSPRAALLQIRGFAARRTGLDCWQGKPPPHKIISDTEKTPSIHHRFGRQRNSSSIKITISNAEKNAVQQSQFRRRRKPPSTRTHSGAREIHDAKASEETARRPKSAPRQTGLCQHPTAFIQRNHSMTTGPLCELAKRPRSQWAADSPPAQGAGTKSRTAFAAAAFCTDGLTSSPDTCAYRWRTRRE